MKLSRMYRGAVARSLWHVRQGEVTTGYFMIDALVLVAIGNYQDDASYDNDIVILQRVRKLISFT